MTAILAMAMLSISPAHAQDHPNVWHLDQLNVNTAWEHSTGDETTVAVIDSGVDATHPALTESLLPGRNFVSDSPPTLAPHAAHSIAHSDPNGHGTAIAGLIAANPTTGNHPGVAPQATILPARVLDANNRYHDSTVVADAITWSVDNGADIINLSLGSPQTNPAIDDALNYAHQHDVLVIACTGNHTTHHDNNHIWFPARQSTTIAVTGTDETGTRMPGALTGPETSLAAPADQLPTTIPGDNWGMVTGTSFATALVSGVAALLRSAYPDASATDIAHALEETADPAGDDLGAGIINPVRALQSGVPATAEHLTLHLPAPTESSNGLWWATMTALALAVALVTGTWLIAKRARSQREVTAAARRG